MSTRGKANQSSRINRCAVGIFCGGECFGVQIGGSQLWDSPGTGDGVTAKPDKA